jgi:formate hydrogenlyase transcriptional activator
MNEVTDLFSDHTIWQRTFDAVPDLIFILDSQHRIVRANRAAARRLERSPEEMVGQFCCELMHGTDQPPDFCPHSRLLQDGRPQHIEVYEPIANGYFAVSVTPLTNGRGETIGAVHVARDITDVQRAKERIEQHHALTVAAMLDGLWEWELASDRVFYSDRYLELLGYHREEANGTLDFFKSLLHDEDTPALWVAMERTLAEKSPYVFEFRLRAKSGEYRWFLTRGQVLLNSEGQPTHMAGIIQDITEQKRSAEALQAALAEITSLKERLEKENVCLLDALRGKQDLETIVGQSVPLQITLHKVEHVAATGASVLLLGETGTGKELLARAIHERSPRAGKPLVKVNCAALPSSLIESELFGHVKGAFTGALTDRIGRFQLADGGTLLLDEIGELEPDLQAKLLRVLQDGEFERVGSTQTVRVDVRLIAATNRDLHEAMREGSFRPDLYYRLSVFPIEVPPLRDRRDDIPLLVWHFITQKQRRLGRNIASIPSDVMDRLVRYDWPGNIRELENVIERAMILSPGSSLMLSETLANSTRRAKPQRAPVTSAVESSMRLEDIDRSHILAVLHECQWRVKGAGNAAERLGMKPSTLRYRMKKLGIERKPKPR